MPFGQSNKCKCLECGCLFHHAKKMSEHIKKFHKLSSIDYVIKHRYANVRPICLHCGQETRFVSLTEGFKKYCKLDRKIAESIAGRVGGATKKSWNKGLTKTTDQRIALTAIKTSGEGNAFFDHHHTVESLAQMAITKRLPYDEIKTRIAAANANIHSTYDVYVDQNSLLNVSCQTCDVHDNVSLFNLERCWRCKSCFPVASRQQLEVSDYVKSLGFKVEVSTRKIISPLELDVWIPSKNLAIEYHGLYWHSGGKSGVFDKGRHRQKLERCRLDKVRLIQFFSDEWINKSDICKSMISNALGANSVKLNARDCKVQHIDKQTSKAFVDANHISGSTRAHHHVGLLHKQLGLVAIATTRTPIQKKHGHVCELARMCFLRGTSVRGGASKLLTYVKSLAQNDGFDGMLSYAELRFGDGGVYEKCGFKLIGETLNNYWYTDGCVRFDRFKFRAQPGKPEKQVAKEADVRPVWGSGNHVYLIKW